MSAPARGSRHPRLHLLASGSMIDRGSGPSRRLTMPTPRAYPEMADPMVRPRYTGLPTFMRAPWQEDPAGLDIALVGVPFDGGVTNRPGARHGPREIRNQSSLMRKVNQASGIDPYALCRVGDVGDAWVEKPYELTGADR